ncbi:MAG: energy-coupling factor ABC transporter ATP-binding protein [Thermoplasmata archaeon]|nr:MAG: ABC transporter ATP-binding protein [Aciduliprofundum sp.]HEU12843.1 ABC transporter ATP-binding protein [Euryarchaeota archaeon]
MCLYILQDISFSYNRIRVLEGINLRISRGEFIAIVGPNGAGKSTLLKILDFLMPPDSGSIYFMGKKIDDFHLKSLSSIRKKVGLVFQDPDVELFSPTVREDLAFGPIHMGLEENDIDERIRDVSRILNIEHLLDKPPFYLSDGEKKKAAIASVLTMDPEVLMVDEPTANLDPRSRREIVSILKSMWKGGKTIIISTHELNIINDLVERIIIMNSGRIVKDGNPMEILGDKKLLEENNLI